MEPTAPPSSQKPSKVEALKIASEYLKTWVAEEVNNGLGHFSEEAATVLKFHGSYQQDDRDLRTQLKREKKEKAYQLMVRIRVVGGRLTADQRACGRRSGHHPERSEDVSVSGRSALLRGS
jgi:sulfite reductase (ferredoxin)